MDECSNSSDHPSNVTVLGADDTEINSYPNENFSSEDCTHGLCQSSLLHHEESSETSNQLDSRVGLNFMESWPPPDLRNPECTRRVDQEVRYNYSGKCEGRLLSQIADVVNGFLTASVLATENYAVQQQDVVVQHQPLPIPQKSNPKNDISYELETFRGNKRSVVQSIPRFSNTMELGPMTPLLQFRLMALAEAVVTNDEFNTKQLSALVKKDSDPKGNAAQRLSHYCLEAFKSRQIGNGEHVCDQLSTSSSEDVQQAMKNVPQNLPLFHMASIFAAEEVCAVASSEDAIHVVHFGSWPPAWRHLILRIAVVPNGCRKIRLTVVDSSDDSGNHFRKDKLNLAAIGRDLVDLATSLGLSLDFRFVKSSLLMLQLSQLELDSSEALIVMCELVLGQLPDSSVLRCNPRDKFLKMLHNAAPKVVLSVELNFNLNSPFFLVRFKDILKIFTMMLEDLDQAFSQHQDQWLVEKTFCAREVMNAIACEGLHRYLRLETYSQWRERFYEAGFAVKGCDPSLPYKLQHAALAASWEHTFEYVDGALYVYWKELPYTVLAAWRRRY